TGIIGQNINNLFTWSQDLQPITIDYNANNTAIYPDLQYIDHAGITHFIKIIVAKVSGQQENNNSAQAIVTIHDETKTRELENMKIDFVSMAAHELRTPLASLRGYIELMSYREGKNMSEDANKYLKQALKSSKELGGLINNLLDVTRIERGTLTFDMEEVDLAASVSQSVANSHFGADDKQIKLTYEGPQSGCMVMADHLAIREVINNLVSNAIKYTAPNGSVSVSLKQEGNSYITRVRDTGIGIPKSALPYLFTKFYRVHGGLDSGSTGTGLGLFISKSIIERHNGTISVESEEGVGSVFSFTVPVLDKANMAAPKADKQPEQSFIRRHRGWVTKNIAR
ncbi:MAG TPA: ATP-binding protein, partial [Candidatus Saccharimonadales bacterium]